MVRSHHGFSRRETDRRVSFCAHAIQHEGIFAVEDTHSDGITQGNPLVTGDAYLRSYAGKRLITTQGHALGTLCVLDTVPRKLTEEQNAALDRLAQSAMRLLEIRRRSKGAVFAKAVNAASDGVVIAAATLPGSPIVFVNKSFLSMIGAEYHSVVGQPFTYPISPEYAHRFEAARLKIEPATIELPMVNSNKQRFWDRVSFVPYINETADPVCLVMMHCDITIQKELDSERLRTHAMHTTMKSVTHIVLNFMNAVQVYRSDLNGGRGPTPEPLRLLDAAMQNTRERLRAIDEMPIYKERSTPFGFSLLDTDEPLGTCRRENSSIAFPSI